MTSLCSERTKHLSQLRLLEDTLNISASLVVLSCVPHWTGKQCDCKWTTGSQMGSNDVSSCEQKGCVQQEAFLFRNGSFSESIWKPCSALKLFNPSQKCLMVCTKQCHIISVLTTLNKASYGEKKHEQCRCQKYTIWIPSAKRSDRLNVQTHPFLSSIKSVCHVPFYTTGNNPVSTQVKRFLTSICLEIVRIATACIASVQFALFSGVQPTGISYLKQICLGFASH